MSSILSDESAFGTPADVRREVTAIGARNRGIPRWVDVLIAGIVLVVAAPLITGLAVGIAITSGAPVFFRQRRVGLGFRPFVMIKLRTMKSSDGGPKVTSDGDRRVTRLGRLLRKTKLDELPAFWNVLRGEMALVGPRPEVPEYVNPQDPLWQTVLSVRPGVTDPVTISLRNEEQLLASAADDAEAYYISDLQPLKLRGYVEYLERRTVRSDFGVLWGTITAVLKP